MGLAFDTSAATAKTETELKYEVRIIKTEGKEFQTTTVLVGTPLKDESVREFAENVKGHTVCMIC